MLTKMFTKIAFYIEMKGYYNKITNELCIIKRLKTVTLMGQQSFSI